MASSNNHHLLPVLALLPLLWCLSTAGEDYDYFSCDSGFTKELDGYCYAVTMPVEFKDAEPACRRIGGKFVFEPDLVFEGANLTGFDGMVVWGNAKPFYPKRSCPDPLFYHFRSRNERDLVKNRGIPLNYVPKLDCVQYDVDTRTYSAVRCCELVRALCQQRFGEWGRWDRGVCTGECGERYTYDVRQCFREEEPAPGKCKGEAVRERKCNYRPCSVWSEWSDDCCPVTCGPGTYVVTRRCVNPENGRRVRAKYCGGNVTDKSEVRQCRDIPCPEITTLLP